MRNRWSKSEAKVLNALDLLVYTTRLIGEESNLVLWGGGNSSVKLEGTDHVGSKLPVLWIKGSGADMKTMTRKDFTPLRLNDLLKLGQREKMTDEDMVAYQRCCMLNPTSSKPSIETLLHAFLPATYIYHTHADAICTLTDTPRGNAIISEVFQGAVSTVPYVRPGFELAKRVRNVYTRAPSVDGIILEKHGLVTWGDSSQDAYKKTIALVSKAEQWILSARSKKTSNTKKPVKPKYLENPKQLTAKIAPILRGALSQYQRTLLLLNDSPAVLAFVNDPQVKKISQCGPFTPDHILYTKAKPLCLSLGNLSIESQISKRIHSQLEEYRKNYITYFKKYSPSGVTMMDSNPRIILIPGIGMFTSGKDFRACMVTNQLYEHTIQVIQDSTVLGKYAPLSLKHLCDFEYWPMENFKLTLLPKERELSRRIALVTGAGGEIGAAIATKLVQEGASVILTDIKYEKIKMLSAALNAQSKQQCSYPIAMDVSKEASVQEGFRKAVLAFGGLDVVISNAGIARSSAIAKLSMADWSDSISVNATGHFLVCREAMRVFEKQGIGGNFVVVSTKNVLAPGKEFGAYSASKAAQAQLAKVLALEGADIGVRVNMVNPDGVFGGSGLWSKNIRHSRAKSYGISDEELEEYCISRNLLKVKITAEDVSEAVFFLASDRSSKTSGAMIPVDGGMKDAFPR